MQWTKEKVNDKTGHIKLQIEQPLKQGMNSGAPEG